MLVRGVSPTNTQNREWRRSEPGTGAEQQRNPFRFSTIDVILDLSADAIRQTGRHEAAPARPQQFPPDTYTNSGTLAYAANPERAAPSPFSADTASEAKREASPRSGRMHVTFDGLLRSPSPEPALSPTDH